MNRQAFFILPRDAEGPLAPPPRLTGALKIVSDAIGVWAGVEATTHWHLHDQTLVDGIDFYVGRDELGHIHLDGSIHVATTPERAARMTAEGLGRPFPWARGWTLADVDSLGIEGAVALFRRNYERLRPQATLNVPGGIGRR